MRYLLALFLAGFVTAVQASVPVSSVEDFITSAMPQAGSPGLAYAVVDNGEISSGERGEILRGSGTPVSPDTPFVVGSISKSFTALAVMQLVEAGRVDLDTAVSQYLDVFSESPARSVTIRQLLSHTSGYSTLQGNDTIAAVRQSDDALRRQVERIAQWTPAFEPGTRWDYSNANYYILGALIEQLSGQDYASYVETQILAPLGMTRSFVADGESYATLARGHTPWFGTKRPVPASATDRMSAPVGGVIATASDMALYLAMMMNGEDHIISAGSKAEMMRPASEVAPFYGLGWYVDTGNGIVSHAGLTPGVETLAVMLPAERKGAVVLINASGGMGFGETAGLINGIVDRALGFPGESTDNDTGDGGQWSRKALFLLFAMLPVLFGIGLIQVWLQRAGLRAKSGLSGTFSLWFPLVMTLALAWTSVYLIPRLFGVSLGNLWRYSPDLALILVASGVTGVAWSLFRLGVFHSGARTWLKA